MSFLEDATRWRRRAKHARALASHTCDAASKRLKLKTAAQYEKLALLADRRRAVLARRTAKARALAEAARKANADRHAAKVLPIISEAKKNGARSLRDIAEVLTARGVPTRKGGRWHAASVKFLPERAPALERAPAQG